MRTYLPLVLLGLAGVACGPSFGDECQTDYSCGTRNTCDLTVTDGYCTRTPCHNYGCDDDDAVCVQFVNGESYCMLACEGSGDCRDGHACQTAVGPQPPEGCGDDASCPPARCPADQPCTPRDSGGGRFCYVP